MAGSIDPELCIQHALLPAQIEVRMDGGGVDGGAVGLAAEVDPQSGAHHGIGEGHFQGAGITVVAVRGDDGKADCAVRENLRIPDALVNGVGAAVELIQMLVGRQFITPALQREGSAADAVGIAADTLAEKAVAGNRIFCILIADGALGALVFQSGDRSTQGDDGHFQIAA